MATTKKTTKKTLTKAQKLAMLDKYKKDVMYENDNGEFFFSKSNAIAAMVDKKNSPTEYSREGLTSTKTENA